MPLRWRPDGVHARDIPKSRRLMPHLMRRRNESIVFFEQKVDATRARAYVRQVRERTGLHATILHLLIWAAAQTLSERPRLNRFTAGGRIYDRRGIWVSFSAKKAKTDDAPIVVVKREIDPGWDFETLVREIESDIGEGRSDRKSTSDRELDLIFLLPNFLVARLVGLLRRLDHWGLLPGAMIRTDPFFASIFIANLGSIGMDAGFHHLYEYGNIPIFLTVAQTRDEVVAGPDGTTTVRPLTTLRYSFDERVEDGLYCLRALERLKSRIEDPEGNPDAGTGG